MTTEKARLKRKLFLFKEKKSSCFQNVPSL